MQKKIFKVFLILIVGVVIAIIDKKYYIYAYYRVLNGNSFLQPSMKLAAGFYFYNKDKSDASYVVFHRDISDVAMFVFTDKKPDLEKYLNQGLVFSLKRIDQCNVYKGSGKDQSIYIDFDRINVINAVLSSNKISQEKLNIFCKMIEK